MNKETPVAIADCLDRADFPLLLQQFLYNQLVPSHHYTSVDDIPLSDLPKINPHAKLSIYHSAVSTFFAPSNLSGVGGMRRKRIRALPSWRRGPARYDTVLVSTNGELEGMLGFDVGRVRLFFSFIFDDVEYPCALIDWYDRIADSPDGDTGMWIVKAVSGNSAIIHIDAILRCAHLIPVFGPRYVDRQLGLIFSNSLDAFLAYYVNKYADHHMHEIVF